MERISKDNIESLQNTEHPMALVVGLLEKAHTELQKMKDAGADNVLIEKLQQATDRAGALTVHTDMEEMQACVHDLIEALGGVSEAYAESSPGTNDDTNVVSFTRR